MDILAFSMKSLSSFRRISDFYVLSDSHIPNFHSCSTADSHELYQARESVSYVEVGLISSTRLVRSSSGRRKVYRT